MCGGVRCSLPWKNNVLVENVEMPVRAISHRATVERLGHEHKVPLVRTGDIDGVFPELRRHALTKIRTQAVDALRRLQSQRAVGGQPGLLQPVRNIARKVFPHRTRHRIGSSRRAIQITGIDPISLDRNRITTRLRRWKTRHQSRIAAEVNIVHIAPFAEVISVRCRRDIRRG